MPANNNAGAHQRKSAHQRSKRISPLACRLPLAFLSVPAPPPPLSQHAASLHSPPALPKKRRPVASPPRSLLSAPAVLFCGPSLFGLRRRRAFPLPPRHSSPATTRACAPTQQFAPNGAVASVARAGHARQARPFSFPFSFPAFRTPIHIYPPRYSPYYLVLTTSHSMTLALHFTLSCKESPCSLFRDRDSKTHTTDAPPKLWRCSSRALTSPCAQRPCAQAKPHACLRAPAAVLIYIPSLVVNAPAFMRSE